MRKIFFSFLVLSVVLSGCDLLSSDTPPQQLDVFSAYGHSSVVFNNKMWVIGGSGKNDVWSSTDGTTWTQVSTGAQFSPRSDYTSLVFDNKMWVIGGSDNGVWPANDDVWSSVDGKTWIQSTAGTKFSARETHTSLVFNNKMWVIGGINYYPPPGSNFLPRPDYRNDAWSSTDGDTWTQ